MTVKCNSVTYVQKINAYRGHHAGNKKDFVYAVNKYGPMAEILATKSSIENIRYQHLIEEKDDYAIVKIYHAPTDTVFDILIDKDDIERVEGYKWYINTPDNARTLYVANDKLGKLHRYLLNVQNSDDIIDHINRNGLDNRKSNLRITTASINSRNMDTKSCNKCGCNGVSYEAPTKGGLGRYKAKWMEGNRLKSKSFALSKFPNALELAIEYRKKKEKENFYTDLAKV